MFSIKEQKKIQKTEIDPVIDSLGSRGRNGLGRESMEAEESVWEPLQQDADSFIQWPL